MPHDVRGGGELLEHLAGRRVAAGLLVLGAVGVLGGYAVAVRGRPKPLRLTVDGPSASPGAAAQIVVHVAGAVGAPGIVRVREGARIDDVLAAAGGVRPDGDVDAVNLAARVRDGDKVFVPTKAKAGAPGASRASSGAGPPGRVSLNSATAAELDALPGIGPALAQRIIAFREEHGGFRTVRDLLKVPGIGPSKFESLEDLVTV